MKFFVPLLFILLTAKSFAQQPSNAVTDSIANVDNMPVVKDNGKAADMPIRNGKGNAADMPTSRVLDSNPALSSRNNLPQISPEFLKNLPRERQDTLNPKGVDKRPNLDKKKE
ncbi:hypothetical protein [Tellurirhabdus bombi]|uniref:hypothetical protein n=1 Tax=Tellurirhabdus bombi TaxID=2907205 RepID=UPI001F2D2763|nr:hypothetical protein [Tellurirhabdus bombi]